LVSKPTKTLGSDCRGNLRKTTSSIAGLNLAAHPAALAMAVNFIGSPKTTFRYPCVRHL
jgi:hypothetical protein